jgi:hypothetical protein
LAIAVVSNETSHLKKWGTERGAASRSRMDKSNDFGKIKTMDSIKLLRVSDPRSVLYETESGIQRCFGSRHHSFSTSHLHLQLSYRQGV